MLPAGTVVRRATLDDLEALRGLWRECCLPEYELEKRFTEFQVVVDATGWILGALGLRFANQDGQIHSLAIRRLDLEADLLPTLWERALSLAEKHGALRLWTRERGAFWPAQGFAIASGSQRRDLPAGFGAPLETWSVKKLRDEPLKLIAAEEQLEAFLEMERYRTDQMIRRGRFIKLIGILISAGTFILVLTALFKILAGRRRSQPPPDQP